jgi:zinc transport system substrate-binding protein
MEIAEAQAFFTIGMPFEERLAEKLRGSGVGLRFVDMAAGVERRALAEGEGEEDRHGHSRGHLDPHVWLAPALIERLAENSALALQEMDPGHAADYARGLEEYRREIRLADERTRAILAPVKGGRFYVFHPDLGYFADAYGLEQVAVETEGKEPTPQQLAQLIAAARSDSVRVLFVQPQFSAQAVAAVASAIGGVVVPVDPLARDVLPNLERIAQQVHDALAR